jgi:hypothetical protein
MNFPAEAAYRRLTTVDYRLNSRSLGNIVRLFSPESSLSLVLSLSLSRILHHFPMPYRPIDCTTRPQPPDLSFFTRAHLPPRDGRCPLRCGRRSPRDALRSDETMAISRKSIFCDSRFNGVIDPVDRIGAKIFVDLVDGEVDVVVFTFWESLGESFTLRQMFITFESSRAVIVVMW